MAVVALCLMATAYTESGDAWQLKTDNCRMGASPDEPLIKGGYWLNGKRHLRMSFKKGVQKEIQEVVQESVDAWNAKSEQTNIVFEIDATAKDPDIWVQNGAFDESEEEKACALYEPERHTIWYKRLENWHSWIHHGDDRRAAIRIFTHEMGHAMGIDHKFDDRTVMREGSSQRTCRLVGRDILSDITPSDVRDAARCVRAGESVIPSPPPVD